ncbi:MAG TPA: GyrI-like domain-containing protein [Actinocrinis sp.]|nr:GyrI-like domain-containing protein [Actinocrinis sp.]
MVWVHTGEIFLHERGEATVFVPVAGAVRAVGRVVPFVVPGAELAVVRHSGSLDDVDVTYGALGAYAMNHEISVDGPLREYYLCGAQDTDDAQKWETEIGWPVFRADAGTRTGAGGGDRPGD